MSSKTGIFMEGFFIKDLSCYTDGTKKIVEYREGVLGDLLTEEERGYFVWFCSLDSVPIRILFPKNNLKNKELFFSCSLAKNYRITGDLVLDISRGIGSKDYYIVVHTFTDRGEGNCLK